MIKIEFPSDTNESYFIEHIADQYGHLMSFFSREGPYLTCSVALDDDVLQAAQEQGGVVIEK